jgi:sulfur-oxidizing protein SoxY
MLRRVSRREALTAGAGAFAAGVGLTASSASALNNYAEQIKAFTGGRTPVEGRMKVALADLPDGEGVYVEEILVVAPANPNARVIRFRFSPASVPEASTRIRLAETQDVIAVGRLSDGTFVSASRQIKVTIGGCGG